MTLTWKTLRLWALFPPLWKLLSKRWARGRGGTVEGVRDHVEHVEHETSHQPRTASTWPWRVTRSRMSPLGDWEKVKKVMEGDGCDWSWGSPGDWWLDVIGYLDGFPLPRGKSWWKSCCSYMIFMPPSLMVRNPYNVWGKTHGTIAEGLPVYFACFFLVYFGRISKMLETSQYFCPISRVYFLGGRFKVFI